MSKLINIGVVGAGVFGGYHAAKIQDHPGAALAGVFDVDCSRAVAMATRFGAPVFDDFVQFLASCDAVVIAAPASAHFGVARDALCAGRHVFVEKPITLNLYDADALVALAGARGLVLQTGHQERYVADAAGLFRLGRAPSKIDCVRRTVASGRCEDVSVVLDLMIHDLDLVRRLTGAELVAVDAHGGAHEATAELTLANGTIVSLVATRRATAPERRMTLVYDDGVVEFDFVTREIAGAAIDASGGAADKADPPAAFRDPLAFGTDQFISAIKSGTTPQVSGEDGRAALAWALAIERAAAIEVQDVTTTQRAAQRPA